jgi:tRNA threonylcarbamoyladenosine biosynthesis protein TsaE
LHSPDVTADFDLPTEAATQQLGGLLAAVLQPGMVVHLDGDLGAGKTTLVRALLRAAGHVGPVKSPTYSLVEVYVISSLYWYHFDFYRFESPEEFHDAGLGDYFNTDSVCLVEWPEKAAGCAPAPDLCFRFLFAGDGRCLQALGTSEKGKACLTALISAWRDGACSITPAPR